VGQALISKPAGTRWVLGSVLGGMFTYVLYTRLPYVLYALSP